MVFNVKIRHSQRPLAHLTAVCTEHASTWRQCWRGGIVLKISFFLNDSISKYTLDGNGSISATEAV